ncbi:MAG TPA: competence/damage-inducible protein A [Pyrinomonadaceae bacterium]|nr:competence/damage-inducible protein A [Pyrinomonadaceae bacterium]
MLRSAEIIAIGSELLGPSRVDTNSLWLTEKLGDIGVEVQLKTIVGDDTARLEEAIADAVKRADVIITTGGLGPTEDDITRGCTANAVGRKLVYHDEIEAHLRERFKAWGRKMPEINKRQAFVVEGCEILENPRGSAVGMLTAVGEKRVINLPGPPRENQPMFTELVLPRLKELVGDVFIERRLMRIVGMGESAVDEAAAPIYTSFEGVQTSILFNKTEVELQIAVRRDTRAEAEAIADELTAKLADAFGIAMFTTTGEAMEAVVGRLLLERGETVAFAESCTGGLVSRRITEVPGSSAYFLEGLVAYSYPAKVRMLGVSQQTLDEFGAVSAECASEMAEGALRVSGATHAVSVTGIAGPDGGTDDKPVGTVFFAYSGPTGTRSIKLFLPGDRYLIRWRSSQAALDLLRRSLLRRV